MLEYGSYHLNHMQDLRFSRRWRFKSRVLWFYDPV